MTGKTGLLLALFVGASAVLGAAGPAASADLGSAAEPVAPASQWRPMSIDLALTGTLDPGGLDLSKGIAIARGGSVDWVDPLIGGRIRHQLAPGQELTANLRSSRSLTFIKSSATL